MATETKHSQALALYKCREHFTTEPEEKARKTSRKSQLDTAETMPGTRNTAGYQSSLWQRWTAWWEQEAETGGVSRVPQGSVLRMFLLKTKTSRRDSLQDERNWDKLLNYLWVSQLDWPAPPLPHAAPRSLPSPVKAPSVAARVVCYFLGLFLLYRNRALSITLKLPPVVNDNEPSV